MLKEHVKTILVHKKHVGYWCFKMGIPWRGIVHDLLNFLLKNFLLLSIQAIRTHMTQARG